MGPKFLLILTIVIVLVVYSETRTVGKGSRRPAPRPHATHRATPRPKPRLTTHRPKPTPARTTTRRPHTTHPTIHKTTRAHPTVHQTTRSHPTIHQTTRSHPTTPRHVTTTVSTNHHNHQKVNTTSLYTPQGNKIGGHPPPYGTNVPSGHPPHIVPGHPPQPPSRPGAPPVYSPPPTYQGGTFHPPPYANQPGGTTIINNNINNHHVNHAPPAYPSYSYHSSDTGSGTLGFFLGYSLGKLKTPSYNTYTTSFYDGYSPKYDHYEVHHYYHNQNPTVVKKERVIEPNSIVGCAGDSGNICPASTMSLCTSSGAIMCVASATTTVPCTNEKNTNCVKSTVPCVNSKVPGCEGNKPSTQVTIPCISTAKIYGQVTYVNNMVVVNKKTDADSNKGKTTVASAVSLSTTPSPVANTSFLTWNDVDKIVEKLNISLVSTNLTTTPVPMTNNGPVYVNSTTTPVPTTINNLVYVNSTTTPSPTTTPLPTHHSSIVKREVKPEDFCVTILALPAKRKLSVGEKTFNQVSKVAEKFFARVFG